MDDEPQKRAADWPFAVIALGILATWMFKCWQSLRTDPELWQKGAAVLGIVATLILASIVLINTVRRYP